MFFNKKKVIQKVSKENVKVIEVYKKGGYTFQLFCDAVKASGTRGLNVNYCVSMLTVTGYSPIADNRLLDIPEIKFEENKAEEILEQINKGFTEFKAYVDMVV